MGKQINFYATKRDMKEILNFAEVLELVVIPELVKIDKDGDPELPKITPPTQINLDDIEYYCYFFPTNLPVVEAFYGEVPSNSKFGKLMSVASPVIEFKVCKEENNILKQGRLYFDYDKEDKFYPLIFKKYNALVRYIRTWYREDKSRHYIGPDTLEEVRKGTLNLKT
jgi:hypothetical protein